MSKTTAQTTVTETCGRCNGTGRHSYTLRDGDKCYGCMGRGTKTYTAKQVAARNARRAAAAKREAAAAIKANETRDRSAAIIARLDAAFAGEFDHIDEEYRHMHVAQKAQRIAMRDLGLKIGFGIVEMEPHLDAIIAAA